MNTALSIVSARIAAEDPDRALESFTASGIELTLNQVDDVRDRSWSSASYGGSGKLAKCGLDANVRVNQNDVSMSFNIAGHTRVMQISRNLKARWGYDDSRSSGDSLDDIIPPKYVEVRRIVDEVDSKITNAMPKFRELAKVKSFNGLDAEISNGDFDDTVGHLPWIGWKLKDYPIEIFFDVEDKDITMLVRSRLRYPIKFDLDTWPVEKIVNAISKCLKDHGFPGDKTAEIDVILRDKRLNKGERIFRYDVSNYRTALEQIKVVLEQHKAGK
jgi:hypothetical protein